MNKENKSTFVVATSENKQNEQEKQKYFFVAKPDTGKLYFLSSEVLTDWIVSAVSETNTQNKLTFCSLWWCLEQLHAG